MKLTKLYLPSCLVLGINIILVCSSDLFQSVNNTFADISGENKQSTPYICDLHSYAIDGYNLCVSGCTLNGTPLPGSLTGNICPGGCLPVNNHYSCASCGGYCYWPGTVLTLYRFAQTGTGDHWYSINQTANAGTNYVPEVSLGKCLAGSPSGMLPLLEYVKNDSSGYHFYTTNATEGAAMVSNNNFIAKGVVCSLYPAVDDNLFLVYQYFSGSGIYLLTASPSCDIGTSGYWTRKSFQGFVLSA